jgi:Phosphatidylinositol N-acetylglucosaminyltransferase
MVTTEPDRTGEDGPEWERVLWRLQPFPDNYVPPTFLAGLSKNRNQCFFKFGFLNSYFFTANVLPYRYWPLMLGACTISQHLSVIFIFLAVFTRLLDHTLDPRLLVVLSSATFVVGCIIWEAMEYFGRDVLRSTPSDRRKFVLPLCLNNWPDIDWGPRCTHGQGVPARLSRAHRTCTHPPDAHRADVRRLDLGPHDSPLPRSRCARRLLVRCVSGQT